MKRNTKKPAAAKRPPTARQVYALEEKTTAGLEKLPAQLAAEVCRRFLVALLATDNGTARAAADSVLRADYWRDVRDLAEQAIEAHPQPGEARDEWLTQTIDGHERVIYTGLAAESLGHSGNADAMEEETGAAGTTEQRCFYALLADVREKIDAIEPAAEEG